MEILSKAIPVVMLIFVLSSMLAMGLGLTVGQIMAPLRNLRLVALSLAANFVVMPLVAFALGKLLRLDEPLAVGLLVLGAAGGAPFLPLLAQLAKANLAFAVGLMVLLMVITVGFLPLALPLFLPGVSVNPAKIARSLILMMLLPLAGALVVNAKFPLAAARAKPPLAKTSSLSLILVIALLVVVNFKNVLSVFGTRGILAGLLFIGLAYGLAGCSAALQLTLGLSLVWAPRNAISLQRSWSEAKVLRTRRWW
jgi:BASS family bile acid:Na+ symporter